MTSNFKKNIQEILDAESQSERDLEKALSDK